MNPAPDFSNLLKVLRREIPSKPVLFEFFLNTNLYSYLAGENIESKSINLDKLKVIINAFYKAGYDYATVPTSFTDTLNFPKVDYHHLASRSINEGGMISDWASFERYPWPDPSRGNYEIFKHLEPELHDGMKLIACAPGGVLENIIDLVGYERLCYMTLTEPDLAEEIFTQIGSRLVEYYKILVQFESIGAFIVNDDWGFKTQTMFDLQTMRTYVFPWHKQMVEVIHSAGKQAILHSCGYVQDIMDDIIDEMKYDGKHSFEDAILPIEEGIEKWGDKIAMMGGIDLDFLVRSSPQKVYKRAYELLNQTAQKGGYALGSGNSIPDYVPYENYFAMIRAAKEWVS